MFSFGPRVGKVDVKPQDGFVADAVLHDRRGIGTDHSCVFQARTANSIGGVGGIWICVFDSQEIDFGPLFGAAENEGSLARSDFDFQWKSAAFGEDRFGVQRVTFRIDIEQEPAGIPLFGRSVSDLI